MSDDFDPYRKWLGIPISEQPPHYYRLLGVPFLEDDADVIQNAADRQMAHVRTFQTGKHAAASQRLLNELSLARTCLLDKERKASYDRRLQTQLSYTDTDAVEAPPPVVVEPPLPAEPPVYVKEVVEPSRRQALSVEVAPPLRPAFNLPPIASGEEQGEAPAKHVPGELRLPPRFATKALPLRKRPSVESYLILGGCAALALIVFALVLANLTGGNPLRENSERESIAKESESKKEVAELVKSPAAASSSKSKTGGTSKATEPFVSVGARPETTKLAPANVEEKVRLLLNESRKAFGVRDLSLAHQKLTAADALASPVSKQREEVEQIRILHTYLGEFLAAVNTTARNRLKPGETVKLYGGGSFRFLGIENELITFEIDQSKQTKAIRLLPAKAMLSLARMSLKEKNAQSNLYLAAFMLLDDEVQNQSLRSREQAQVLWRQAARWGVRDPYIARELGINESAKDDPLDLVANELDDENPWPMSNPGDRAPALPVNKELGKTVPKPVAKVEPPALPSLPDDKQLSEARDKLKRTQVTAFGMVGSKIPEQRQAGLELIRAFAADENTDRILRFVAWERLREIAAEGNHVEAGLLAIAAMASEYPIDLFKEKLSFLYKLSVRSEQTQATIATLLKFASEFTKQAKTQYRFRSALEGAELVERLARRAKNNDVLKAIGSELSSLRKLALDEELAAKAEGELKTNPNDAAANLAYGRFLCLGKNAWKEGLPYLAKGGDADLRELAKDDLAGPSSSEDRLTLGDRWFDMAQHYPADSAHRLSACLRARHWYKLALPKLSGAPLQHALERIQAVQAISAGGNSSG